MASLDTPCDVAPPLSAPAGHGTTQSGANSDGNLIRFVAGSQAGLLSAAAVPTPGYLASSAAVAGRPLAPPPAAAPGAPLAPPPAAAACPAPPGPVAGPPPATVPPAPVAPPDADDPDALAPTSVVRSSPPLTRGR